MKIIKCMLFLGLVLLFNLIKTNKHKKHGMRHKAKSLSKRYDATLSDFVMKDFLNYNIDQTKDTQKILVSCFNLIAGSYKNDKAKRDIWEALEKFAMDSKTQLAANNIKGLLKNINNENANSDANTDNKGVPCNEYILGCLKSDDVLNSDDHMRGMRLMVQNEMGVYQDDMKKSNGMVTSFASYYRDSSLRHPDLFKRLNKRDK